MTILVGLPSLRSRLRVNDERTTSRLEVALQELQRRFENGKSSSWSDVGGWTFGCFLESFELRRGNYDKRRVIDQSQKDSGVHAFITSASLERRHPLPMDFHQLVNDLSD